MPQSSLPNISNLSLHKIVYNTLKKSILSGKFKPGEKLNESLLSTQLSVSKTPLREVIRELGQEGLITHEPRRGIFVVNFTENDVTEIVTLRAEIEAFGMRLAIPRLGDADKQQLEKIINDIDKSEKKNNIYQLVQADLKFHYLIIEKSGHGRLKILWKTLASQIRVLLQMIKYANIHPGYSRDSHQELFEIICSGDTKAAEESIKDHILTSGENILNSFKKVRLLP